MTRPTVVSDIVYFSGRRYSPNKNKPGGKLVPTRRQFRNLLKYLTYREGSTRRDLRRSGTQYRYRSWEDPELEATRDEDPAETVDPSTDKRWVDRGLGDSYRDIYHNTVRLGDRTVLARTWVLSPDPLLMDGVPEEERTALMARMTERTIELFHESQGWPEVEYSYVIHERETQVPDQTDTQLPHVHAHVVSAGTYYDYLEGTRVGASRRSFGDRRYFIGKEQLADLRDISQRSFHRELVAVLGHEKALELLSDREVDEEELGQMRSKVSSPSPTKADDLELPGIDW